MRVGPHTLTLEKPGFAAHSSRIEVRPFGTSYATFHLQAEQPSIIDVANAPTIRVGVVAAGKLGGFVLGTGAAFTTVDAGHHRGIAIVLAPVEICVAGALYCGGHQLAGDSETLYRCNSGSVPTARGARCAHGCAFHTDRDDACLGGPLCQDGGKYCGGDKVDGDPKTLYTCMSLVGVMPKECANGCLVRPGTDDICK